MTEINYWLMKSERV